MQRHPAAGASTANKLLTALPSYCLLCLLRMLHFWQQRLLLGHC
jgi:hypothetical protein